MAEKIEFTISTETILRVVFILLGFWLLWAIRDIVVMFLIVLILVAAMSPVVDRWSQRMPRPIAIGLLYGLILSILIVILYLVVPPLVIEIRQLALNLPDYVTQFLPAGSVRDFVSLSQISLENISDQLARLGSTVYSTTGAFLSGLFAVFTVFVLTFYLLIEEKGARKFFLSLVPNDARRARMVDAVEKIGQKMGAWVRGQLTLMVAVGLVDLIGLYILGVPYALTLGIWAGLTELIPYVGPIIGAIPAVILAFGISPLTGFLTIALFALVQQLEAQLLVPKIMQKAVGLSPVVIILAIMVGAKLMGMLGVLLAVPLAAGVSVLVREEWNKLQETLKDAERGL